MENERRIALYRFSLQGGEDPAGLEASAVSLFPGGIPGLAPGVCGYLFRYREDTDIPARDGLGVCRETSGRMCLIQWGVVCHPTGCAISRLGLHSQPAAALCPDLCV